MVSGSVGLDRALAVSVALIADRVLGEPPSAWHPVARFGQAMERAERSLWADRRSAGTLYALAGGTVAVAAGAALAGRRGRRRAQVAVLAATYLAVADRALAEAAGVVSAALEAKDLAAARSALRSLVGRRTDDLDEAEIIRAAVESVAENTVDAVTAPLLWALVGGAPAALGYRAVNTLDAMVGHRTPRYQRFGWASARADDLANWVPARLTALAVAAVRPGTAGAVRRAVGQQAPAHPSPNAGVIEAAFAAALGIRMGGLNHYPGGPEDRPALGSGPPPEARHIAEACRLSRHATAAMCATSLVVTAVAAGVGRSR